jgi:hypothetical protein
VQFTNQNLQKHLYNRVVIELTDVDSLTNDDSVTVTSYRGREPLMTNATGQGFLPGGTQTVDTRWGKSLIHAFKGRIVDGVLITEPGDFTWPASGGFEDTAIHKMRGMRLRLNLTPERAEGLMAGYADVETVHLMHNKVRSTHLQSYGQQPAASLYKAMYRLADGYPDPVTGTNTAIPQRLPPNSPRSFSAIRRSRLQWMQVSRSRIGRRPKTVPAGNCNSARHAGAGLRRWDLNFSHTANSSTHQNVSLCGVARLPAY